jgi:hypothetical protein
VDTERRGSWRERARDPALTALLIVQIFILLIAAPTAATGHWSGRILLELAVLVFATVVFVISHGRVPTAIAACGIAGMTEQLWALSSASSLLGIIGGFAAQVLVIYLLGHAVLAPGEITRHRVVGAVALYLALGMAFAGAYRLASQLVPGSLANAPGETERFQGYSSILLFQLRHTDISGLRRHRARAAVCPSLEQSGSDHWPALPRDIACSPCHA